MAGKDYSEDLLIQAPTAERLEQLGWKSLFAWDREDFGPDSLLGRRNDTETVLTREVLAALRRLNPGLPEDAYRQALAQVLQDDITKTLVQLNAEKYRLLRDGVPVQYRDPGGRLVDKRLRLIDFDDPSRNRYLAVRELWIRGRLWRRRPDLIGFVNGLPLVFIELKRFEVHIDNAYKQNYADYLDTIPHLFHWNQLVILSNGHDAQYGSPSPPPVNTSTAGSVATSTTPNRRATSPCCPSCSTGCSTADACSTSSRTSSSSTPAPAHCTRSWRVTIRFSASTASSTRADIIVISDEAHRTQYGRLALNMRKGLPHARFLGFTGTPLIDAAEQQLTREVFGDYVSIYDFQRAVADGATLPLFYENAGEKLRIVDPKLSERIADYIEAAKQAATPDDPWTDAKEDKLYRELARDYPILTAPTRLDTVARHFVDHFHQRWRVVDDGGGKALLVCLDKITCVKMHDLIVAHWNDKIAELEARLIEEEARFAAKGKAPPELLGRRREQLTWMQSTEVCVVVSPEQGEVAEFAKWRNVRGEPLDIRPHREKMVKRDLEQEFKRPDHPFRIAIVCAMWLTGFDVKCLATLYLDKPMRGHTLMQAIARVNRVGGGKKHGLIIDYNGMIKSLRQALATFAQGDRAGTGQGEGEPETVRDEREALAEYADSLQAARAFLTEQGVDLEAVIAAQGFDKQQRILAAADRLCEPEERRKTFEVMAADIQARHRALFPHPGLFDFDAEDSAISAIGRKLREARAAPDVSALLQDLYDVVDVAVETETPNLRESSAHYDLSRIDVSRLQAEFAKTPGIAHQGRARDHQAGGSGTARTADGW